VQHGGLVWVPLPPHHPLLWASHPCWPQNPGVQPCPQPPPVATHCHLPWHAQLVAPSRSGTTWPHPLGPTVAPQYLLVGANHSRWLQEPAVRACPQPPTLTVPTHYPLGPGAHYWWGPATVAQHSKPLWGPLEPPNTLGFGSITQGGCTRARGAAPPAPHPLPPEQPPCQPAMHWATAGVFCPRSPQNHPVEPPKVAGCPTVVSP